MRRLSILISASLMGVYAGCSSDPAGEPGGEVEVEVDAGVVPDPGTPPVPDEPGPTPGAPDSGAPDAAPEPRAAGFDPDYSLPGVAGRVAPGIVTMAPLANRQFVVGGNFEYAGDAPAKGIAIWNGAKWSAVGAGFDDRVVKVATHVATGDIYAVTAVAHPDYKVHKWSQKAWTEIGTFNGQVRSLEATPDGTLYVAGTFTMLNDEPIQGFATYDGSAWSTLGAPPRSMYAVRVIGDQPCIGGKIGESDSVGVACFDGAEWVSLTGNMAVGTVHVLGELDGEIIAAGNFSLKDDKGQPQSAGSLARWTGTEWKLIGGGMTAFVGWANPSDMVISGSKIYVIGEIARVGGSTNVQSVAMYDTATSRWSDLNGGLGGYTGTTLGAPGRALTVASGGEVYAGGTFSLTSGRNAFGIARWDGNVWNPVDEAGATRLGVNGRTQAVGIGADGSVYVGGTFGFVGGDVAANSIARLKDGAWYPLGNGIGGTVQTITLQDRPGGGQDLYAGGAFVGSGTVTASNIAKWNGATWSTLGPGLNRPVSVIKVGPDGKLYVGGEFTNAGDLTVNRIAVWDGVKWSALGDGFADGRVAAIAFGPDGKLYAGGTFKKSGTEEVRAIAVWDGTAWEQLAGGFAGPSQFGTVGVYDIAFYEGKLTVSGQFTKVNAPAEGADDAPLNNVAVLEDGAWKSLGGGLPPNLPGSNSVQGRNMVIRGKDLYVTGLLQRLGDPSGAAADLGPVAHLAKWDGAKWSEVGGGLSDVGNKMASTDDSLWIVGSFTWAGSRGSTWLARYWYGD